MERTSSDSKMKQEEDVQAGVEIWKYVFGFTSMAVVKCATELEIAEAIENHEGLMALSDLSSTVGCVPFSIDRIVRFLVHRHFFKEEPIIQGTAANGIAVFEAAHGADLWKYAAANPAFNKLIDDAMACDAGLAVSAIIESSTKRYFCRFSLYVEIPLFAHIQHLFCENNNQSCNIFVVGAVALPWSSDKVHLLLVKTPLYSALLRREFQEK
ncbi:hypothetical protein OIU78_008809 [Salix suchowensis]|nr:hypothetical protein OIU78_008809 [Salix suchowensis]